MTYSISPSFVAILNWFTILNWVRPVSFRASQRRVLRRLPGADAAGRNLGPDLVGVAGVPEHQQAPVAYHVGEALVLGGLLGRAMISLSIDQDAPAPWRGPTR
jgi:hypothetical protein